MKQQQFMTTKLSDSLVYLRYLAKDVQLEEAASAVGSASDLRSVDTCQSCVRAQSKPPLFP